VTRAARILAQRSADTVILLNPQTGHYYTLDEVGARVWDLCDGSRRVKDVVATIHDEYDAPVQAIQTDVMELLDDLARELLVSTA
jgi:coenzyme PQQ synthesis protein D (PqqD)